MVVWKFTSVRRQHGGCHLSFHLGLTKIILEFSHEVLELFVFTLSESTCVFETKCHDYCFVVIGWRLQQQLQGRPCLFRSYRTMPLNEPGPLKWPMCSTCLWGKCLVVVGIIKIHFLQLVKYLISQYHQIQRNVNTGVVQSSFLPHSLNMVLKHVLLLVL